MISVSIATRGRPESFKKVCQVLLETADNPSDIEFVIYRDNDDESKYEYPANSIIIIGKRIYTQAAVNECYKLAKGDIHLFMADDIIFETKGWDTKVKEEFEKIKDRIAVVHLNDYNNNPEWGTLYFLHRNWMDAVGYAVPPEMCRRGDVWVHRLGKTINRRVFLTDVFYKDIKIRRDNTHKEYIKETERTDNYNFYYSNRMKRARTRDADKLKKFIDNYGA